MPRTPQVQRTIKTIVAAVLCLDLEKQTTFELTVRIPKPSNATNRSIINAAEQAINDKSLKVLHILNAENQTVVCTMSEQTYLNNANIITIKGE